MRKLICKILILLLISNSSIFLSACNEETTENEHLTYYTTGETGISEIIERYNKYCLKELDESYTIEVIEFDDENKMNEQMSTEIMAGKGPDIFSLDQTLPFEKLTENGAFADIDALIESNESDSKINLNDYRQIIMDAGVIDGKRYFLPLFYGVDVMKSFNGNLFEKYNIPKKQGMKITYDEIETVFANFLENQQGDRFILNWNDSKYFNGAYQLLYKFIDSYVDFETKTTDFDCESFRNNLDAMCSIYDNSITEEDTFDGEKLLFDNFFGLGFSSMAYAGQDDNQVVFSCFSRDKETCQAFIEAGIAVNANCTKIDKVLEFMKYLLSEDVQEYYCGDKDGSIYGGSNVISLPVRNEAYEHSIYMASKVTDDDYNVIGLDTEIFQAYLKIVEGVNKCSLYADTAGSYYNSKVIKEIVDDYLNGKISKDKLVQRLTSATELYMTE